MGGACGQQSHLCSSQQLAQDYIQSRTEVEAALTIIDTTTVDEAAGTFFSLLAPLKSQWTPKLTLWMGIQN